MSTYLGNAVSKNARGSLRERNRKGCRAPNRACLAAVVISSWSFSSLAKEN